MMKIPDSWSHLEPVVISIAGVPTQVDCCKHAAGELQDYGNGVYVSNRCNLWVHRRPLSEDSFGLLVKDPANQIDIVHPAVVVQSTTILELVNRRSGRVATGRLNQVNLPDFTLPYLAVNFHESQIEPPLKGTVERPIHRSSYVIATCRVLDISRNWLLTEHSFACKEGLFHNLFVTFGGGCYDHTVDRRICKYL